jgi:hypothetical protein
MKFNLEERLIKFAVAVLDLSEKMPDTKGSNHLTGQYDKIMYRSTIDVR